MKRRSFALALGAMLALAPPASSAQEFPTRVITIIVPYPAGGPTDATARVVAAGLSHAARPAGGGGECQRGREHARHAARRAGRARRLHAAVHNMAFTSAIALLPNVKLDPVKDFAPVGAGQQQRQHHRRAQGSAGQQSQGADRAG